MPAVAVRAELPVKINVVTTTGMIADLAARVGGERVQVTALMGPGVDPHLYKAAQGDLGRLEKADIIFYNGLHLEGKMNEILEKVARKKPCFPIASEIPEAALRKPPEFDGNFDPHIWFDINLWLSALDVVYKKLSEHSPSDSGIFENNYKTYRAELGELNNWVASEIRSIPEAGRVLITAHDAFGYFGRAYHIEVRGLQGISTAGEFGLHDLTALVQLIIDRRIKAVFVESSVPQKFIESLKEGVDARGGSVQIGGQLFSDAMGEAGSPEATYPGMIRHNVTTIVNALK